MSMSSFWQNYYENGLIPNIWKGITGQTSADRNADLNLEFQRERNRIEDERYREETAYNRDFAENERDYNRAMALEDRNWNRQFLLNNREYERDLQQQIFEREDTAIERQAQQLSKLGINPLTQNMNGLGSGAIVGQSSPMSAQIPMASSPSASTRGGQALNRAISKFGSLSEFLGSFESVLRPLQSINQSIQDYNTGNITRDALALENDKKFLENFKFAHDLGIDYPKTLFNYSDNKNNFRNTYTRFKSQDGEFINFKPEFKGTLYNGWFDSDYLKNLNTFSNGGFNGMLERSLTKGSELVDKASQRLFNLDSEQSKKFNLFNFLNDFLFK